MNRRRPGRARRGGESDRIQGQIPRATQHCATPITSHHIGPSITALAAVNCPTHENLGPTYPVRPIRPVIAAAAADLCYSYNVTMAHFGESTPTRSE